MPRKPKHGQQGMTAVKKLTTWWNAETKVG